MLVHFPQDETGKGRKLSRPWHGPYRVVDRADPDLTVVNIYSPQDGQIHIHQSRVAPCPTELPGGFYWYGDRRARPGRPPRWVDQLLQGRLFPSPATTNDGEDALVIGMISLPGIEHDEDLEDTHPTPGGILPIGILDDQDQQPQVGGEIQIETDPSEAKRDLAAGTKDQVTVTRCRQGLRSKTTPPSRLMTVCSRTSTSRGGRDVKPITVC